MGKVAAIQNNASGSIEENLVVLESHIARAVAAGAELVLLPEHCMGQPVKIFNINRGFWSGAGSSGFFTYGEAIPCVVSHWCDAYSYAGWPCVFNLAGV